MKIQHLAVVFILIILPISIIFSSYVENQIETINMESQYDTTLLNCTYDAIKAYQLNTINNTESDVTNSKIADIEASVNTFKNSLVTSFGYSGYDVSVMDEYLPAIVYTLYDGYYIYSPFENILTETSVYKDKTYEDNMNIKGLKTYVYYSCRFKKGTDSDFVITFTLDNSITIQGIVKGNYVNESGYLIDGIIKGANDSYTYDGVTFVNKLDNSSDNIVGAEKLEEFVKDKMYKYIKLNGTKYYWDEDKEEIFSIRDGTIAMQMSKAIDEESYSVYTSLIEKNNSAYNYYKQAYEFTNKVRALLNDLNAADAVELDENVASGYKSLESYFGNYVIFGNSYYGDATKQTLIQGENSNFNQMRRAVIRYAIETNLKTAIAGFSAYSNASTNFIMPKISEKDWEIIQNNVTTISFLQGLKIKSKTYNGYAVVPNTLTKEYVDEESIYMEYGKQYFKSNDNSIINEAIGKSSGYLNIDYERKYLNPKYYYSRVYDDSGKYEPFLGSYTSIMGNSGVNSTYDMYDYMKNSGVGNKLKAAYYTALGRERESSFKIYNDELMTQAVLIFKGNGNTNGNPPDYVLMKKNTIFNIPSLEKTPVNGDEMGLWDDDTDSWNEFTGWNTKPDGSGTEFDNGGIINVKKSTTLYAQWKDAKYYIIYDFNIDAGDELYNGSVATGNEINNNPKFIYDVGTYATVYSNKTLRVSSSGKKWILDGWEAVIDGATKKYELNSEYRESKKITMKAIWREKNVKLSKNDMINVNVTWSPTVDIDTNTYLYSDVNNVKGNYASYAYYHSKNAYVGGYHCLWLDQDDTTGKNGGENTKVYLGNISNTNIKKIVTYALIYSSDVSNFDKVKDLKIIITNETQSVTLFTYDLSNVSGERMDFYKNKIGTIAGIITKNTNSTSDDDYWIFEGGD